jgi:hypothetical protein
MAKRDYWECECGQRNHYSTDVCLAEKCLAKYWRGVANWYREQARRMDARAESLETEPGQQAEGGE